MRYRVLSKGKAKHLSIPEKPAEKTASLKAADLDNPYGRGKARAAEILAQAIAGRPERFDLMDNLPVPPFPGGAHLRSPLLVLAMTWYALRDRLRL